MALNILASPSTADQMTPPRFARYEMNTDADAPAPTHVTPQSDDSRPSLESDESSPNRAALGHPQDKRDAGFEFDASMQVTAADNEDPDSSSENDEELLCSGEWVLGDEGMEDDEHMNTKGETELGGLRDVDEHEELVVDKPVDEEEVDEDGLMSPRHAEVLASSPGTPTKVSSAPSPASNDDFDSSGSATPRAALESACSDDTQKMLEDNASVSESDFGSGTITLDGAPSISDASGTTVVTSPSEGAPSPAPAPSSAPAPTKRSTNVVRRAAQFAVVATGIASTPRAPSPSASTLHRLGSAGARVETSTEDEKLSLRLKVPVHMREKRPTEEDSPRPQPEKETAGRQAKKQKRDTPSPVPQASSSRVSKGQASTKKAGKRAAKAA
ncbi:hypothetical protein BDV98DRAFT_596504 [Pterulicium gracile]|uniref:Uncharacterized protein n=1 Tax=Pterulicium gracile TaxID=1884261 RepID=A0A5C3QGV6_9AGAR|nr:hypothetical protein BDV98DRAFT_596504 [Pterula gracilis]